MAEEPARGNVEEKRKLKSRKRLFFLGIFFVIITLISSFYVVSRGGDVDGPEDSMIQGLIDKSPGGLPDYAVSKRRTQAGYVAALEIPGLLERVPCYCGCAAVGHKSLKDCFINDDGTFDDHASYCDLCVSEALDVYRWDQEGRSLKEIRAMIDEKYSRYGDPTDTPKSLI